MPVPQSAVPMQTSSIDKVLHFTFYTVFAFLLSRQISEVTDRWRAVAIAIVTAAAFAAADEWHQRFIPGRSTEFADWLADSLGAWAGALAFLVFRRGDRSRALTTK